MRQPPQKLNRSKRRIIAALRVSTVGVVLLLFGMLSSPSDARLGAPQSGQLSFGDSVSFKSSHGKLLWASDKGALNARANAVGFWERYSLRDASGRATYGALNYGATVSLFTAHNKYVVAQEKHDTKADRGKVGAWERWTILNASNTADRGRVKCGHSIALRSAHGRYLVAESNGDVAADRTSVGAWEKWTIGCGVPLGQRVSLKTHHGRFVKATPSGELLGDASQALTWEAFEIMDDSGRASGWNVKYGAKISLRTHHGKFVVADENHKTKADRTKVGAWEQLTIVNPANHSDRGALACGSKVALRSTHGRYVVAESDHKMRANRTAIGPFEIFTLQCRDGAGAVSSGGGGGGNDWGRSRFSKATFHAKWPCGSGKFLDPRNGGECWSCPSGYDRTIHAVTSGSACAKHTSGQDHHASKKNRGTGFWGTDCPSGQFFDIYDGGWCWSCNGRNRTAAHITHGNACHQPAKTEHRKASGGSKAGCAGNQFHDPRNGGECWSCPNGSVRTTSAVTDGKACSYPESGSSSCRAVFSSFKDAVVSGRAGQDPRVSCSAGLAEGAICAVPNLVESLAVPARSQPCKDLDPATGTLCTIADHTLGSMQKLFTCIEKINTVADTPVTFNPAKLSYGTCSAMGETLAIMALAKMAKAVPVGEGKAKKVKDFVDKMLASGVVKVGMGARTAYNLAVTSCVESL